MIKKIKIDQFQATRGMGKIFLDDFDISDSCIDLQILSSVDSLTRITFTVYCENLEIVPKNDD